MKLSKAKELLKSDIDNPGSVDISDLNIAEQLGIEAINRLESYRRLHAGLMFMPLPGETLEQP